MSNKIGRNSICQCGSGKKFKYCCINSQANQAKPTEVSSPFIQHPILHHPHPILPKPILEKNSLNIYNLQIQLPHQLDLFLSSYSHLTRKGFNKKLAEICSKNKSSEPRLQLFVRDDNFIMYFTITDYNRSDHYTYQLRFDNQGHVLKIGKKQKDEEFMLALFFILLKEKECPIAKLNPSWQTTHKVLSALFNYNKISSLALEGIIITSEKQSSEIDINATVLDKISKVRIDHTKNETNSVTVLDSYKQQQELDFLLTSVNNDDAYWAYRYSNSPEEDEEFFDGLLYYFNDGTLISSRDIIFHAYSILIPRKCLPLDTISNKKTFLQTWPTPIHSNSQNKKNNLLVNAFQGLIDNQQKLNLKFFVNSLGQIKNEKELKLAQIKRFEPSTKADIEWTFEKGTLIGQLLNAKDNKDIAVFNGGLYHIPSQTFTFNSFKEQANSVSKYFHNYTEVKSSDLSIVGYNLKKSQMDFSENFNSLLNDFAALTGREVILKDPINICKNDFKICLDYKTNDLQKDKTGLYISYSFEHEDQVFQATSLPIGYHRIISSFNAGLGNFYGVKNSELAVQEQGKKRQNDLKYLRHGGLFRILFFELLKWYQELKKTEPGPIKNKAISTIQKELLLKMGTALNSIIYKENIETPLNEICSKKVSTLTKKWISQTIKNWESSYFILIDDQLYCINYSDILNNLLLQIVSWLELEFGTTSLLKQKLKDFKSPSLWDVIPFEFTSENNEFYQFEIVHFPNLKKQILNTLRPDQFDYKLNGSEIEIIDDENFKAILDLNEDESSDKIDWFELDPKLFFKGEEVPISILSKLKEDRYIEHNNRYYILSTKELPKLDWLTYFWEKLVGEDNSLKKRKKSADDGIFKTPYNEVLNMLGMKAAGLEVHGGKRWEKICSEFEKLNQKQDSNFDLEIEPVLNHKLKAYQRTGAKWLFNLYNLGLGGILADDMGLGKTVQVIALLDMIRQIDNQKSHLIVVPTSLVFNWLSEIKKFAPQLKCEVYDSQQEITQGPQILITTYGLLNSNFDNFQEVKWDCVFFDEAQNLKNIKAKRTSSARKIVAQHKFALTGTPMENHYGEYYSLIDLCVSGALGDYASFMKQFNFKNELDISKQIRAKDIEFLKLKTAPITLRRVKSQILDQLPEKIETTIQIPFEKKQLNIYRDIALSWNEKIKSLLESNGEGKNSLQMLAALTRLRQACSTPAIISDIDYQEVSPKLALLYERIQELNELGESVIVFTNFKMTLEHIQDNLSKLGLDTLCIHGAISRNKRTSILDTFEKSEKAQILLMTLKTGGVGLNLTRARYVFHIEPWWNPASENQATDRVYRIGQTRSVQVYKYIMKSSVEEKIQELKGVKGKAFSALFDESEDDINENLPVFKNSSLNYEDFQYLLS